MDTTQGDVLDAFNDVTVGRIDDFEGETAMSYETKDLFETQRVDYDQLNAKIIELVSDNDYVLECWRRAEEKATEAEKVVALHTQCRTIIDNMRGELECMKTGSFNSTEWRSFVTILSELSKAKRLLSKKMEALDLIQSKGFGRDYKRELEIIKIHVEADLFQSNVAMVIRKLEDARLASQKHFLEKNKTIKKLSISLHQKETEILGVSKQLEELRYKLTQHESHSIVLAKKLSELKKQAHKSMEEKRRRIEYEGELNGALQAANSTIAKQRLEYKALQQHLEKVQRSLESQERLISSKETELSDIDEKNKRLKIHIEELTKEAEQRNEAFREMSRTLSKTIEESGALSASLKSLKERQSTTEEKLRTRDEDATILVQNNSQLIKENEALKTKAETLSSRLENRENELKMTRELIDKMKRSMKAENECAEQTNALITEKESTLKKMSVELKRMETERVELLKQLKTAKDEAELKETQIKQLSAARHEATQHWKEAEISAKRFEAQLEASKSMKPTEKMAEADKISRVQLEKLEFENRELKKQLEQTISLRREEQEHVNALRNDLEALSLRLDDEHHVVSQLSSAKGELNSELENRVRAYEEERREKENRIRELETRIELLTQSNRDLKQTCNYVEDLMAKSPAEQNTTKLTFADFPSTSFFDEAGSIINKENKSSSEGRIDILKKEPRGMAKEYVGDVRHSTESNFDTGSAEVQDNVSLDESRRTVPDSFFQEMRSKLRGDQTQHQLKLIKDLERVKAEARINNEKKTKRDIV